MGTSHVFAAKAGWAGADGEYGIWGYFFAWAAVPDGTRVCASRPVLAS
jgi:hypothetical protein